MNKNNDDFYLPVKIVGSKGIITLIASLLLLCTILIWGVFGYIPKTIRGIGIISPYEGSVEIPAIGTGQIIDIDIKEGEKVYFGQIIAHINIPNLNHRRRLKLAEILKLKQKLKEKEKYYKEIINLYCQINNNFFDANITGISNSIKYRYEHNPIQKLPLHTKSFKGNLKPTPPLLLKFQLKSDMLNTKQEIASLENKILNEQKILEITEDKLATFSEIKCPNDGIITEVHINKGEFVKTGNTVAILRSVESPLEAVIYLPANLAKKVKYGMLAYIYPSIIEKEQYGGIYGIVSSISKFPVSEQNMKRTLDNTMLIQQFKKKSGGAMFCLRINLLHDSKTPTGFKWSSSKGPLDKIDSGIICNADIVLGYKHPIDILFPKFKEWIGFSKSKYQQRFNHLR